MKRWIIPAVCAVAVCALAADELTVSSGWTYNKNSRRRTLAAVAAQYDVSGDAVIENVQTIATNAAGEALQIGDVTAPGFAWFSNQSTNRYIEIGQSDGTNFTAFLKLNPGEACTAWLAITAPYARASTSAARLDYVIVDR